MEAIHEHIRADTPLNADRVLDRVTETIRGLEAMPRRFPVALEGGRRGVELRQVTVWPYRIVFQILGTDVLVHTIRHGHRRPAEDIEVA